MIYFTNNQIIIRRQRHKSGLRYGFSATGTVHDIDIQPMQAERINRMGGQIGKSYDAWIDSTVDVKEGDQIRVIETGKTYSVQAVSTFEGAGLLDHTQLMLVSQD